MGLRKAALPVQEMSLAQKHFITKCVWMFEKSLINTHFQCPSSFFSLKHLFPTSNWKEPVSW